MKIITDLKNYLQLLMWLETGRRAAEPTYAELKQLYEQQRDLARLAQPLPQRLCGVTVGQLQAYLAGYYGRANAHEADAEQLMRLAYGDWCRLIEWTAWQPLQCNSMRSESIALTVADFAMEFGVPAAARTLQEALNGLIELDRRRRPLKPVVVTGAVDGPTMHLMRFVVQTSVREDLVCRELLHRRAELLEAELHQQRIGSDHYTRQCRRYYQLESSVLQNEYEEEREERGESKE